MLNRVPTGNTLTAKDFWSLVDLFGSLDKTKAFAGDIKSGLAELAASRIEQRAESKRLVDLAAELEGVRKDIDFTSATLKEARQAHAAEIAAFKTYEDDNRKELALERQDVVARSAKLNQFQVQLQRQEAAIVEADKRSQESADRRTTDLGRREALVAEAEARLQDRLAKIKDLAG